MAKKRIVIIGGGFGGVKCDQTLSARLRGGYAELILFNKENHLVFSPLLADVVGSSLSLDDVIVPLRRLLPRGPVPHREGTQHQPGRLPPRFEGHDGQSMSASPLSTRATSCCLRSARRFASLPNARAGHARSTSSASCGSISSPRASGRSCRRPPG